MSREKKRLIDYPFVKEIAERKGPFPQAYIFHYIDGESGEVLVATSSPGFIISKEEAAAISEGLALFVEHFPEEEIERYNQEIYDEYHPGHGARKKPAPEPKQRRIVRGYVYFVADDQGRVKIGKTYRLKDRLGEYTKQAFEPVLLHTIKTNDMDLTEELFHEQFKDKRIRGEWFALTEKDIKQIKSGQHSKEVAASIEG